MKYNFRINTKEMEIKMNKYYMVVNYPSKAIPNGLIKIYINKNPGLYDSDPSYEPLSERIVIKGLFIYTSKMPNATIKIIRGEK